MSEQACGCATQPCGCCEGVQQLTPASECNRPGLGAIKYRVGTHGQFLSTMKARLSTMVVDGVASDGQTVGSFRPLQGLTTRDANDFSIALLDGWATVGDVLSFYQERIANEGYLRTATERKSVLELSSLVGYTLRPGVASTVYLAYTLDDKQIDPVTIPTGARSQSIPGPGELPQSFETSEDLLARREWNNLKVRLTTPQNIAYDAANKALIMDGDTIYVAGVSTGLKAGDKLLFVFPDDAQGAVQAVVRTVAGIDTKSTDQQTEIRLQPIMSTAATACLSLLRNLIASLAQLGGTDPYSTYGPAYTRATLILNGLYLGGEQDPMQWAQSFAIEYVRYGVTETSDVVALLNRFAVQIAVTLGTAISPNELVGPLLVAPLAQKRNGLSLARSLTQSFLPNGVLANAVVGAKPPAIAARSLAAAQNTYADAGAQLLVNMFPPLQGTFYTAWNGARLDTAPIVLTGLYVFRARVALFGAQAPRIYQKPTDPPSSWTDWNIKDGPGESADNAFIDTAIDTIEPGSYVHAITPSTLTDRVIRVVRAVAHPRSAYGISGPSTEVQFAQGTNWRSVNASTKLEDALRVTQLYVQSEALTLVEQPITDAVSGQKIELGELYKELTTGRWAIVSGERADIAGVTGVKATELMMIAGLDSGFDASLPGDHVHTTLTLATKLAYAYKRDALTIFGNVVKATHGETRNETLGNGDGSKALQSFTLKQPPLTFVAAPTEVGADSTLHTYVNDVEWHEKDSLAWFAPKDRIFVTRTDDSGSTTLTFGDGAHGARLPTGLLNVKAVYRNGIGRVGDVRAEQISLLQTRPLGVKGVINPLRASGGADKESRDLARENAPLSVMPLDRLVSVQDYADFTRRFAGIAKALALRTSDSRRELRYLTIAGVDDAPIDTSSDLYRNLSDALHTLGDPDLPLRIAVRELRMLVLSAKIKVLPDYRWESVVGAVRIKLLDAFGFDARALGQPVLVSEIISCIQNVVGVAYVDVDAFGSVSEQTTDPDGTRHVSTPDNITAQVSEIVSTTKPILQRDVVPWSGGSDVKANNMLRPAELAIFTPAVPDTLILNQIS
jgi:predicted phage baseplate assembly protein